MYLINFAHVRTVGETKIKVESPPQAGTEINTHMSNTLRFFDAKSFEGTELDELVGFVHDVFFSPLHAAIGTGFISFAGVSMVLVVLTFTQDTLSYMSALVH